MKIRASVCGVRVEGSNKFIRWTRKALHFIKNKDPPSFSYVRRHIRRVILRKDNSRIRPEKETFFVGRITAFPYKDLSQSLLWYASVLVHEAAHVELYKKGAICNDKNAEIYSIRKQKEALKKLGDKYQFIEHLNSELKKTKKKFVLTDYHLW